MKTWRGQPIEKYVKYKGHNRSKRGKDKMISKIDYLSKYEDEEDNLITDL